MPTDLSETYLTIDFSPAKDELFLVQHDVKTYFGCPFDIFLLMFVPSMSFFGYGSVRHFVCDILPLRCFAFEIMPYLLLFSKFSFVNFYPSIFYLLMLSFFLHFAF